MSASNAAAYVIRRATAFDAPELARLLTVLGHPTSAEDVAARWEDRAAQGNNALVAADVHDRLLGAATLHRTMVLHRPAPVGRITALVVDDGLRGQGIGRALVSAAEEVLERAGCGMLEITSNVRRVEAHAFYERLGYERTSVRLAKQLRGRGDVSTSV